MENVYYYLGFFVIILLLNFFFLKYYLKDYFLNLFFKSIPHNSNYIIKDDNEENPQTREFKIEEFSNKEVYSFYQDYINTPLQFYIDGHYLINESSDLRIWAANGISNRKFETNHRLTSSTLPRYQEIELDQLNSSLTLYDKVILNQILLNVQLNQNKIIKSITDFI
tara:strand:- start:15615 stop:16115 length:501 start_codon:yes stop_codon:yes gene_type:complete